MILTKPESGIGELREYFHKELERIRKKTADMKSTMTEITQKLEGFIAD